MAHLLGYLWIFQLLGKHCARSGAVLFALVLCLQDSFHPLASVAGFQSTSISLGTQTNLVFISFIDDCRVLT